MNISIGSQCYHVENELELRELCIWWAMTQIRRS